jgi:antitoxin component HigA of HigAB toxin-antitoxin module
VIGSRARVAEILNRKRSLSIDMTRRLTRRKKAA